MRNLLMTVCYEGTAYYGFQTQPNGNTIQDHLEAAIYTITREEDVKIHASGRTDAGVHARAQPFHYVTATDIPIERWAYAINGRLPKDIRITNVQEVPLSFHSRRSAKRKTYRYSINANRVPDVFQRNFQFHHPGKLNINDMIEACPYLIGTYDFTSFASRYSTKASHVRTIYDAHIVHDTTSEFLGTREQGIIHFYITGNGFLQHMVRIIVGTLLEIGEGKRSPDSLKIALDAKDRAAAGPTAESHGLMLWSVEYDEV